MFSGNSFKMSTITKRKISKNLENEEKSSKFVKRRNVHWWQQGPIYQIYPKSFCDSNSDGIGDLKGDLFFCILQMYEIRNRIGNCFRKISCN